MRLAAPLQGIETVHKGGALLEVTAEAKADDGGTIVSLSRRRTIDAATGLVTEQMIRSGGGDEGHLNRDVTTIPPTPPVS